MASKKGGLEQVQGVPIESLRDLRRTLCKRCGSLILWARSKLGNWMPMDTKPSQAGTHVLYRGKDAPIARVDEGEDPEIPRLQCHQETCKPKTEEEREFERNERRLGQLQRQINHDKKRRG